MSPDDIRKEGPGAAVAPPKEVQVVEANGHGGHTLEPEYKRLPIGPDHILYPVAVGLALFPILMGDAGHHLADDMPDDETHPFFPDHFWPYPVIAVVMLVTVGLLSAYVQKNLQLEQSADPRAVTIPRPDWYFLFLFQFLKLGPELCLVGSSPEIMVRVEGDKITIRPLAGTRRRGQTEEEDDRLAAELIGDPKERAEHIMLVDLGRNDLGRVCDYGTVKVEQLMTVERFSHVMHLVSTLRGRLREDVDCFDALMACFPAGTVSGAPKVRAMEIIEELERTRRGIYAGGVLYMDFAGNLDSCIALRTMVVKNGVAHVQAGGGIVADSTPEGEYQESVNKSRALLTALEVAHRAGRFKKKS